MRLMDADNVLELIRRREETYTNRDHEYWVGTYLDGLADAYRCVDVSPEVPAVPVEWIKKYIKQHNIELNGIGLYEGTTKTVPPYQIVLMLKDWEKENETN